MSAGGQERSDRGINTEEDLDRLYGVDPAEFTELRKELVAEAVLSAVNDVNLAM